MRKPTQVGKKVTPKRTQVIVGGFVVTLLLSGVAYWTFAATAKEDTGIPMTMEYDIPDIELHESVIVKGSSGIYVTGCEAEHAAHVLKTLGYEARVGPVSKSFPMIHGPHITVTKPPFHHLKITRAGKLEVHWNKYYEEGDWREQDRHRKNMRMFAERIFYNHHYDRRDDEQVESPALLDTCRRGDRHDRVRHHVGTGETG